MALVIEDGSIVSGATSFGTRAAFIGWAAERGYTIADDEVADSYMVKAWDFIKSLELCLIGDLVSKTQNGAYPRYNLVINGFGWDSDEIPQIVIEYQFSLALDTNNGIDVFNPPASASVPVKRSRVEGAVEEEYAVSDAAFVTYRSLSNDLRSQLCQAGASGFTIPVSMG